MDNHEWILLWAHESISVCNLGARLPVRRCTTLHIYAIFLLLRRYFSSDLQTSQDLKDDIYTVLPYRIYMLSQVYILTEVGKANGSFLLNVKRVAVSLKMTASDSTFKNVFQIQG